MGMENTVSAFGLVVFAVAAAALIFLGELVVHRCKQAPPGLARNQTAGLAVVRQVPSSLLSGLPLAMLVTVVTLSLAVVMLVHIKKIFEK